MSKVWEPVEETLVLRESGNLYKFPKGYRLCRLTDAPGDMPEEVRDTLREALDGYKRVIKLTWRLVNDNKIAAIDAALAYLDALP